MPQRSFPTNRPCYIDLGGGVILEGRQWDVMPPLPTPLDDTAQANTYRAINTNKVRSVDVFYIRYATAPRFGAPVMHIYPVGTNDCTQIMPVAPQTYFNERDEDGRPWGGDPLAGAYNWPRKGTREDEDCHFFMFLRPSDAVGLRPGLMHFHGGSWVLNSALGPQHAGDFMAAHCGVACAYPTYRLSTLGNYPHPDLLIANRPSVAFLDQRMALLWFHGNATAMGVNPATIGISGTSAGGAAVQQFLVNDDIQANFSAAWIDSGGGGGTAPGPEFYTPRTVIFAKAVEALSSALSSNDPTHRTVADVIATDGLPAALVNGLRKEHVQALSDIGPTVTRASVKAALAGTGSLVASKRTESENPYPYRQIYASGIDAAKDGKFRKPCVITYAECEPLGLVGNNGTELRDALNALPIETLNGLAQRLGFVNYTAYVNMWTTILTPFGFTALKQLPSSIFNEAFDPGGDAENRRVLFTHAFFGYPAWRIARAMAETNSAPVWLGMYNFSPNAGFAGHSAIIQLMFGQPDWSVGAGSSFPAANPPGVYADVYMDAIYMSEILMWKLARLCANGDPDGPYTYANNFDLFNGNPPANGGSLTGTWSVYTTALAGHHNVIGKALGEPIDNLNATTSTLKSHEWVKTTHEGRMGSAFLTYLANLEP